MSRKHIKMNCAKYQLDKNLKGRNIFSYKALDGIGKHMCIQNGNYLPKNGRPNANVFM